MKRFPLIACALLLSAIAAPCLAEETSTPSQPNAAETQVEETQSTEIKAAQNKTEPKIIPLEEFTISRKGDLEMSCQELYHEAKAMSLIIEDTSRVKSDSKMQSRGISAAGAVGSLLVGTMTGGIGLAVGGLLLDHNVGERREDADKIQDIAEQRRTFMMGIYTAQGCEGDIYAIIEKEHPAVSATPEEELQNIQPAASSETRAGIPESTYNN